MEIALNIRQIIKDAGGPDAISLASQTSLKPIGAEAVKKWTRIGIPEDHWPTVMSLSGKSVEEIYTANAALREPYPVRSKRGSGQGRAA